MSESVASGGPGYVPATTVLDTGTGWPARPKILVDGVPLIDSLIGTIFEDMAINSGIGAQVGSTPQTTVAASTANTNPLITGTAAGYGGPNTGSSIPNPRPLGTMWLSRKTSLAQRDFGLLETGEIFLSTNPGTQIEVAGYPWGTVSTGPMTLNAVVGQVVPSGALIQGLPEV
jgi:hypothetical protein